MRLLAYDADLLRRMNTVVQTCPGRLRQINPSIINSTPIADLAALTGWPGWMCLVWELLDLSTLNTRRFLFRLPESLSRWPAQTSLDLPVLPQAQGEILQAAEEAPKHENC